MKRSLFCLFFLLLFGAVKLPLELRLAEEHRRTYFHGAQLNLDLREQIGQGAFLAALSGFRSVVADLLWIQANIAWQNVQWERMEMIFNSVTALQPRVLMYWEMGTWHLAWNASVYFRNDESLPTEALRIKKERDYWLLGRDFLERGIRNNPDRYRLYEHLGFLLREKLKDHAGASAAYAKAAEFPNAPSYNRRFAAYELSKVPGKEREAYDFLRKLYDLGPQERLPTLISTIKKLEEKLAIPMNQRIYNQGQSSK